MLRGLQAIFDAGPLGTELLASLKALRVDGVRADCQGAGPWRTAAVTGEVLASGLRCLTIVADASDCELLPEGAVVEVLNEPDITLNGRPPVPVAEYRRRLFAIHAVAERRRFSVWAGAISNLNRPRSSTPRGLDYLRALDPRTWPAGVGVTFHRYPHGDRPETPHPGFASRDQEMAALLSIIGSRPHACSEFGYHTGNRATSWLDRVLGRGRCWTLAEQHDFTAAEWRFLERAGSVFGVLYQINSGPTSVASSCRQRRDGDCFGIRDMAGDWLPVARTFAEGRS